MLRMVTPSLRKKQDINAYIKTDQEKDYSFPKDKADHANYADGGRVEG